MRGGGGDGVRVWRKVGGVGLRREKEDWVRIVQRKEEV